MKTYQRSLLIISIPCLAFLMLFISFSAAQNSKTSAEIDSSAKKKAGRYVPPARRTAKARGLLKQDGSGSTDSLVAYSAPAVAFIETPAVRDLKAGPPTPEQLEKVRLRRENQEKNANNVRPVKPESDPSMTGPFKDPTLFFSDPKTSASTLIPNLVTSPLQNFDGPDMDQGAVLFGGRFAPPDTNAAVGPNHVVITCNAGFQVFSKTGVALTPLTKISTLLAGIPGAADDDGDPIVLYDGLADRWLISQFRLTLTNNSTHEHVAISKTSDPLGAYYAYDFLLTPNRVGDYPHLGVWPDGYYMATNDFNTALTAFLGAGLYSLERNKMLAGDPTAKIIGFNTPPTDGGMLPTNLQGFSTPPAGTPNLFVEFDADEFGALTDLIRVFEFRPNYVTPASSTLTQLPDITTAAFDARQPTGRADIAQPAPGEGLDSISDRLMHAMNFRVLPGNQQSYVLNWTVNVSGVNPTNAATYQGGVRWMELRRNSGTGAITINQEATYAPGSGNPTGRDLWMASVAQDGEGNIGLAANASNSTATPALLNPTALYTGRLAGDPANTLPQGEVDALSAVTKGVQTATSNRWGDYSSLFADPADDCTFWGAFEYVDSPTATFDWNTRLFSFKVNPNCVTPARGSFSGVITNCSTGLPIDGATVQTSDGFLRTTDAAGAYSVINVAPGTYTVNVSKSGFGFNTVTGPVTVTNGGNAIFNACLQGVPIIAPAGSTITAESCVPADNALSPGETVTVSFGLKNSGAAPTTNLVATLQATGGVTSPSGPQNYGAIPPDNTTVVSRPFTFTVDPSAVCGGTVTATLQLQDGANNLGTVTFTLQVGAPGAPVTASYSSGNIAVPIPDVATVEVPISVPDSGLIQDVNVRVRLNHTFDGDLVISLVHPDGTVIALSNNRGGSGANYGTGANDCSGTPTVFDDEAGATIASGVAPFAGSFRPDSPLSGFDGKLSSGTWKLRVADTAALDVGTIGCVILEITRAQFVCCGVAGTPNIAAGPAILVNESCPPDNNAIDPGESVTVNLELHNSGTAATTNLVATLVTGGGV
ncbi:MAG: proprotein convertase P-domain-containing protein, partial [Pyrinomonadaceae bacterium]|nr:proprotein convertase P-domain-containing protein [Pyrinomonadaceae bacterium]